MTLRSLPQWLQHIESHYSGGIDLGLERLLPVAQRLQVTAFTVPVIIVAGTNGKGSCVQFLSHCYTQAGYCVGTYTSPHLWRFNERITVNQKPADDAALCTAFACVEAAAEGTALTYFEFTTLAALYLFKTQAALDVIILEVGLGGRLDAVNVVTPNVAIVTTVDLDHCNWLGPDRESIGREKAGIFRQDALLICGDPAPPTSLLEQAQLRHTPLMRQQRDFGYELQSDGSWSWWGPEQRIENLPALQLPIQNASTALMALTQFSRLPVSEKALLAGLAKAHLPGRYQQHYRGCAHIFDVAHNPEAARYLASRLQKEAPARQVCAIIAMLEDKDVVRTITPLLPFVDTWFVTELSVPRALKREIISQTLKDAGALQVTDYVSPQKAYQAALAEIDSRDRLVIFGSFFIVAELLDAPL